MPYPPILDLIPQRPPFVLVDEVLTANNSSIETLFQVPDEHYFTRKGIFHESGLIENMAQTAAAHAGYLSKINNEEVKLGFIGAVKKLQVNQCVGAGETIRTQAEVKTQLMNATIVDAQVFNSKNEIIASCSLSIFLNL